MNKKTLWIAGLIGAPIISILTPFDLFAVVVAGAVGATARAAWKDKATW